MQQVIGNVKLETSRPVKVINVNAAPILLGIISIIAALFASTWILDKQNARVAESAQVEAMIAVAVERVYAEAQIDALEGRLKVIPTADGISYRWIDSPWSDGRTPRFNNIADYRSE